MRISHGRCRGTGPDGLGAGMVPVLQTELLAELSGERSLFLIVALAPGRKEGGCQLEMS